MNEPQICVLERLRRPSFLRDLLFAVLAACTLAMPCYAGVPEWWMSRGVIVSPAADDNYAALTAGQLKHTVTQAVAEMNEKLPGGAGTALNSLVAGWLANSPTVGAEEVVNVGQLKAVLKLWYDRLNQVHGTSGYPWSPSSGEDFFQAVNVGQLKHLMGLEVTVPPDVQIPLVPADAVDESLTPPKGEMVNRLEMLASPLHHLNNPWLNTAERKANPLLLPAGLENMPNATAATTGGEFKVGQDGAASYTIRLQGPKGTASVEPAMSLDYNSSGGDGVMGLGWTISGISVINRGPATVAEDGFYDPADMDANDRFYLDGERLICVQGTYGADGSIYHTAKEQFSKITYHRVENPTKDWFEVRTKAGLRMEFGNTEASSISSRQGGARLEPDRFTWAVNKVADSLGNYWSVEYADMSFIANLNAGVPYLPDYHPIVIRYTGNTEKGLQPPHMIRFWYEDRPDAQTGYLRGYQVQKRVRLRGVEISTEGEVQRSWSLRYNYPSGAELRRGERSQLVAVQEHAGTFAGPGPVPSLPATEFEWEAGGSGWSDGPYDPAGNAAGLRAQRLNWPGGTVPAVESEFLRLDYRGCDNATIRRGFWFSKQPAYVDMDADGMLEILVNHRGVFWTESDSATRYHMQNDHRYYLKQKAGVADQWDVMPLGNSSQVNHLHLVPVIQSPNVRHATSGLPYLTTASFAPTGAYLMDVNHDGLPDMISSGSFDESSIEFNSNGNTMSIEADRKVVNASGVWLNTGGDFVKDVDGQNDSLLDHDASDATAPTAQDAWGAWRLPKVPSEWTAVDGGTVVARPAKVTSASQLHRLQAMGVPGLPSSYTVSFDLPQEALSSTNEVLADPQFARFNENDLGWRIVDLDGDGLQDIVRGGQGVTPSGWEVSDTTVSAVGTGALSTQGRELCFALRNLGPSAPAGSRWALMTEGIWKLPLPLVGVDGRLDLGRRLIDLNGDGLPDFVAQKKRAATYAHAPWSYFGMGDYDLEVWINKGSGGWVSGGDAWKLEGLLLSFGQVGKALSYGRMLQDINGDGLPDYITSHMWLHEGSWVYQKGVVLNTGNGWLKTDGRTTIDADLAPPEYLHVTQAGITSTRPFSLMDMTGDGRPELLNGLDSLATTIPGTTTKVGMTRFLQKEGFWQLSPEKTPNVDWNIHDNLLADGVKTPLNFVEVNGDGVLDVLESRRLTSGQADFLRSGQKSYVRVGTTLSPRIRRIVNGLGVPMQVRYGHLPALARETLPRYEKPATMGAYPLQNGTPAAQVVTEYETLDGTEDAAGLNGGTTTTHYRYGGYRSHALKGSLGFETLKTFTTLSRSPQMKQVHQLTRYSQEPDLIGMALGGETWVVNGGVAGQRLSLTDIDYTVLPIATGLEAPGLQSKLAYASKVTQENWSPEGVYMGKKVSTNVHASAGPNLGLLTHQEVTLDQATLGVTADDESVTTVHEYAPKVDTAGAWRFGQIARTTVTSSAAEKPSVQKVSAFTYYESGTKAGLLATETIDPGTLWAVTKEHGYDDFGNTVKTLVRASGNTPDSPTLPTQVTETWYDESGRFPIATANTLGHATCTTYDTVRSLPLGTSAVFKTAPPTASVAPSGPPPTVPAGLPSTQIEYDAWGTAVGGRGLDGLRSVRLTQYYTSAALPRALYYVYEQSEGSTPVVTYYDRYHRPLVVEGSGFKGEPVLQEKQYDFKGRPVRVSKPYFAADVAPAYTLEEYDDFDRKVKVTGADGSYVTFEYEGYTSKATNHRGQMHQRTVDMNERLIRSTDTDGNYVTFAYSADGQPLTTTTHFAGSNASPSTTITTRYNEMRLKESVTDPNAGTSTIFYDALGRTQATRASDGLYTVFRYDVMGRVLERWTGVSTYTPAYHTQAEPANWETHTVNTFYDAATDLSLGKPASVSFTEKAGSLERTVTELYSYDALGRATQTTVTLANHSAQFDGSYTSETSYYPLAPLFTGAQPR